MVHRARQAEVGHASPPKLTAMKRHPRRPGPRPPSVLPPVGLAGTAPPVTAALASRERPFLWVVLGAVVVVAIGGAAYRSSHPQAETVSTATATRVDGGVRSEEITARMRFLPTPENLIPPRDCAAPRPWIVPDRDRASTLSLLTLTVRDPTMVAALEPFITCGAGRGCVCEGQSEITHVFLHSMRCKSLNQASRRFPGHRNRPIPKMLPAGDAPVNRCIQTTESFQS